MRVTLPESVVDFPAALLNTIDPVPEVPVLAKVVSAAMDSALASTRAVPLSRSCAPASVIVPVPSAPLVSVPPTTTLSAPNTSEPALKVAPPENVLLPALIVSMPVPDLSNVAVPASTPVPSEPRV